MAGVIADHHAILPVTYPRLRPGGFFPGDDMSACIYDDYPSPPEGTDNMLANARFIASSRSDVPTLADALESVMAERDTLAAAKWADKHTDTMNDMVLMGMARDEAIAENVTLRARVAELEWAAQALGAMPEGYCFCSKDRIGDDSKEHEPECAELRAALRVKNEAGE